MIRRLFAWLGRRAKRPERKPNKTMWSWLSSELLLVGGLPVADHWSLALRRGGATTPLEARNVRYEHTERGQSSVLLVRLPGEATAGASLALDGGRGRRAEISQVELHEGAVELPVLVERALTGGVRRSREALEAALVADSLDLLEHPEGFSLAGRLKVLRDALNEPLGERVIDAQVPQTVFVDTIMAVDDRSFWIAGWLRDADRSATSLLAVSPEGQRAELLEGSYRHPRPDVEELFAGESRQETDHGFVKYVTLPAPSPLDHGWIVELRTRVGAGVEVPGPEVVRNRTEVLDRILSEFDLDRTDRDRLRLEHVMPALERFQEHGRHAVAVEEVRDFGLVPRRPEVSVVVPLYGRIDFVEHQLAQFGGDPQFRDVELVYVLDSPELGPDLLRVAPHLHALHQVPFRVVRLSRNAGFSLANNLGVGESRAPLVLLLNSDVLPTEPGWLGRMAAFYDSTQDIGALGAKLLFEDDSIQHAGMYFQRDIESQVWGNRHYFKGFHRDFAEGRISRPVPAVTGACLMISRELYVAHGGLNTAYVRGGYEDSDLCIRLAEDGKRNWYLADVELYHLEAQSYPSPVRRLATLYNAWLQTHLWDAEIESLARAHAESADRELVASAGLSDSAG